MSSDREARLAVLDEEGISSRKLRMLRNYLVPKRGWEFSEALLLPGEGRLARRARSNTEKLLTDAERKLDREIERLLEKHSLAERVNACRTSNRSLRAAVIAFEQLQDSGEVPGMGAEAEIAAGLIVHGILWAALDYPADEQNHADDPAARALLNLVLNGYAWRLAEGARAAHDDARLRELITLTASSTDSKPALMARVASACPPQGIPSTRVSPHLGDGCTRALREAGADEENDYRAVLRFGFHAGAALHDVQALLVREPGSSLPGSSSS